MAAFDRVAIVNRGEAAMRCIHAVRELRSEQDLALETVALYTATEPGAMFVREADHAVRIGPPAGAPAAEVNPYLDYAELERALRISGADAVWAGWGFVAEHAEFAARCERMGITFVGPSAEVMRRLGDKIGAKQLAEQAGVPVAAWSGGAVETLQEASLQGRKIGYPLVVKATAGGGGRGIRLVRREEELATAFERAREEARRSFGDPTVFMERLVERARHIEVQIIADAHGNVWGAGVRDCSVQRRNQKVLEESASTVLSPRQEEELKHAAAELARLAGYVGAGTVEFLYQPDAEEFAFLEVNTRLQVEHPVTEATTGLDFVKLQLHVAGGGRLEGDPPPRYGHAIEVRLNAEDPERGFSPAPGTIELLTFPTGPGLRIDTGVAEGDVIPPEYDSMVAKLIAWGPDRPGALARLRRALTQTTVLVRGGTTNRAFLTDLVVRPEVVAGEVDTGWLDRLTAEGGYSFTSCPEVALVAAAVEAYDEAAAVERDRFYAAAARGRPQTSDEAARVIDLRHAGTAYRLSVSEVGRDRYLVEADGARIDVRLTRIRRFERRAEIAGRRYRVVSITQGADRLVEVDGVPHRVSQDDAGMIRTSGPSVVVAITTGVGERVEAGSSVAVLESMKMETVLTAPFTGHVREVFASRNVQLDAGAPVLRIEPLADEATQDTAATPAEFEALEHDRDELDPDTRATEALDALRRLVLGYDVPPASIPDLLAEVQAAGERASRQGNGERSVEQSRRELEVLRIFADLASLSRNRRIGDEDDDADQHSAREYLHAFLRSLDADAEALPESFRDKLRRALVHYGTDRLDRGPELERALYRIHLAQQRSASHLPAVLALLDRFLDGGPDFVDEIRDELRETLDRLVRATQVRHPVVGDLARRVRYRCFEEQRLQRDRRQVYAQVRERLALLAADPDAEEREEHIRALVDCPQPLLGMLENRGVADGALSPLLEALTRRYYRNRQLEEIRSVPVDGRAAVVAEFSDPRGRGRVVAISSTAEDLTEALVAAGRLTEDVPPDAGAGAVVDVYVTWPDAPAESEALAAGLEQDLDGARLPEVLRRVTLSVTVAPGDSRERPAVEHLTFHRDAEGAFVERRHLRGIHPLVAARLELWRLGRFELTRLPSAEETYLFHAVAHEEPADQRLFALAEVRDLTPVRDETGAVAALPELERVFASCLDDLRQARAMWPERDRPDWNRVILNVWPVADFPLDELDGIVRALAPLTDGLGLEQVMVLARLAVPDAEPRAVAVRMSRPPGQGLTVRVTDPPTTPLEPFDEFTQNVRRARRRGTVYPYELVPLITREPLVAGTRTERFQEHDLDEDGELVPVDRAYGLNRAGIVVGLANAPTATYPEGMRRVALLGDPTKGLGSVAEEECRRIIGGIDLAERLGLPVEWFSVSSGARISMSSGTENMDWVGRVLRRIIEFTQAGGEINVVVTGINVGAQPYWNAEATMLMHTRGILVMTPESTMVLTGKQALDYSGGVSADDNFGIGGYDRVMGPNGQAQYWARDLAGACDVLFAHYDHAYVAPGERFPRRAATTDPIARDVRESPHDIEGIEFTTVGEIFSDETNPGRKKPFDIRSVMEATVDRDHPTLERWAGMADAQTAVVVDAHLGGYPVAMIGIESRPIPRPGPLPADGPEQFSAGTLFPLSSKKTARAINAASGNRPVVLLANLSGFDGSPESLRRLQLEYGAEIGRAVVNFDGPIVFCVVSRYHGGAFVVFSATLNDGMEVAAVEGSHASVIGGPPAAAVVFSREVNARADRDPRITAVQERLAAATAAEARRLRAELAELRAVIRSEKLGEVAAEFDRIHDVERAREVGSVHEIIPAARLRPYLVDAVERGIARTLRPRP